MGFTLLSSRLFQVISTCFGAGLRGSSKKTWLFEFLHYWPPTLIFCHAPSVPATHRSLTPGSSVHVVCAACKGFSLPHWTTPTHLSTLMTTATSSRKPFLLPPPGSHGPAPCSPTLLSFHHSMSTVVACRCYSLIYFSAFSTK